MLKRQPSEDDWLRFYQYAKRLKDVWGTTSTTDNALPLLLLNAPQKLRVQTYETLKFNLNASDHAKAFNTAIFPRLRNISCAIEAQEDTSLVIMLIRNAPLLSNLSLSPYDYVHPSISIDLLPLLHQKQLTELELPCLGCREDNGGFIPWVVGFLGTCLSLEKLTVCSELISNPAFIEAASNHQHLAFLTFCDSYDHQTPREAPPCEFPRLGTLTLDDWSARNLLATCRFTQLTCLSIGDTTLQDQNVWDAVYRCAQLIGRNCVALRSLTIRQSSGDTDEWFHSLSAPQPAGSFLRPLIRCNQLEEMKIEVTFPRIRISEADPEHLYQVPDEFNLSDDDYEYITSALPNLLIFNYYVGYCHFSEDKARPLSPKPVATIEALNIFALNCTRLLELRIPIDFSEYVPNPALAHQNFKALQTLALPCSIFPSSEEGIEAVAAALEAIVKTERSFPDVRLVGPTCRDWPEGVEHIKEKYEVYFRPPQDVIINCDSWAKIYERIAEPRRRFLMAIFEVTACEKAFQPGGKYWELFRTTVSTFFKSEEGKKALEWRRLNIPDYVPRIPGFIL